MKYSTIALTALMLSTTSAMAATLETGSQTMQWQGTVPVVTPPTDAGYVIEKLGAVDFLAGNLEFDNAGGAVTLKSASQIGFVVKKDDNKDGVISADEGTPLAYDVQLTNVRVGIDGAAIAEQTDGFFEVKHNGTLLDKHSTATISAETAAAGSKFDISTKAGVSAPITAGQEVILQAIVAVTPTDA
ncbi:hypothetical protein PUN50_10115 [Vibrio campbellii]|uniref:Uncharacterized protein n=1 Tax=Vibrio campbellii TaxID=680 RepID=A0AAQ2XUX6_9VIBR|nr:hypothetical protein [Vibrio campbellii]WDG07104.1 hypothetical protein PUN50_10115 [Vibrio campbellii]